MFSTLFLAAMVACSGGDSPPEGPANPPEAGTPEAGTPEAGTPEAGTPDDGPPGAQDHLTDARASTERISRTFRVPAAEQATIHSRARQEIVAQAKSQGFDRADDISVDDTCDERVCTVVVTAVATRTVKIVVGDRADEPPTTP